MLRKLTLTFAAFALTLATAFADEGKVVRIDRDVQQIVLQLDEKEHTVNVQDVKLLDEDGNPATLDQFKAGAKVDVQKEGEKIKSIQLEK